MTVRTLAELRAKLEPGVDVPSTQDIVDMLDTLASMSEANTPLLQAGPPTPGANASYRIFSGAPNFAPSMGTFTLTFRGDTTNPIQWDATTADVLAELEALPSIGASNVRVLPGYEDETLFDSSEERFQFVGDLGAQVVEPFTITDGTDGNLSIEDDPDASIPGGLAPTPSGVAGQSLLDTLNVVGYEYAPRVHPFNESDGDRFSVEAWQQTWPNLRAMQADFKVDANGRGTHTDLQQAVNDAVALGIWTSIVVEPPYGIAGLIIPNGAKVGIEYAGDSSHSLPTKPSLNIYGDLQIGQADGESATLLLKGINVQHFTMPFENSAATLVMRDSSILDIIGHETSALTIDSRGGAVQDVIDVGTLQGNMRDTPVGAFIVRAELSNFYQYGNLGPGDVGRAELIHLFGVCDGAEFNVPLAHWGSNNIIAGPTEACLVRFELDAEPPVEDETGPTTVRCSYLTAARRSGDPIKTYLAVSDGPSIPSNVVIGGYSVCTAPSDSSGIAGAKGEFLDSTFGPGAPDDLDYSEVSGTNVRVYAGGIATGAGAPVDAPTGSPVYLDGSNLYVWDGAVWRGPYVP